MKHLGGIPGEKKSHQPIFSLASVVTYGGEK
jgi:hypothetical protein